jgi:hypothetical protein
MLLNHAGACGNANNGHTWHIFLRQIGIARGIETLKKVAVRTAATGTSGIRGHRCGA